MLPLPRPTQPDLEGPRSPLGTIAEPHRKAFVKTLIFSKCVLGTDAATRRLPCLKVREQLFPELMRLSCFDPGQFSTDAE